MNFLLFAASCAAAFCSQGIWLCKVRAAQLPWLVWTLAAMLLAVTWHLAARAGDRERQRIRGLTEDFARLYGSEMETRGHWKLASDAGPDDPLYLELIETEKRWLGLNPSVNDIYTLRRRPDGKHVFLVDSETDYDRNGQYQGECEQRTQPGEVYEEAGAALERAFRGETMFALEPITDRWGTWVSAFMPLRTPEGLIEAAIGVDFEAAAFTRAIAAAEWRVIGLMAVAQIVLLAASTVNSLMRAEARERQHAQAVLRASEHRYIHLIQSLPAAVHTCDADGRVTLFNKAAAELWGREPQLGGERWCGSWRVFDPHGAAVLPEDCPMAVTMKSGRPVRGREIVIERPDGARAHVLPYPELLRDASGAVIGAVNMFVDLTERRRAEEKLARVNRHLQEISHQAGMAEVATSVLHNVGNVLNSANVSLEVATAKVRQLKIGSLGKAAAILREHSGDLPAFFASTRGSLFSDFLSRLAEHFAARQSALEGELNSLRVSVGHIKEIVAMQQSHAAHAGVIEELAAAEVIEDVLRINAAALERHGITVRREFDPALGVVALDRHKVLQILINLIGNAKYAMKEPEAWGKKLTIRTANIGGDSFCIAVIDRGAGIAPRLLTRIFEHGFTTKKEGHGFGLHASANAARQMHGTLRVESDGIGRGTTFTLTLPLRLPSA